MSQPGVFDNFTLTQVGPSAPVNSDGSFGPGTGANTTRTLTADVDINSTSTDAIQFTTTAAVTATVTYVYAGGGEVMDPTWRVRMQAVGVLNPPITDITMTLVDASSNTQTLGPSGGDLSTIWWDLSNFQTNVNLNAITNLAISVSDISTGVNRAYSGLVTVIACVACDTLITLKDGKTQKQIQDIVRGDEVIGSSSLYDDNKTSNTTVVHKVARVVKQTVGAQTLVDIVTIPRGTFYENVPSQDLVLSANHAILFKNARRPAKCFASNHQGSDDDNNKSSRGGIHRDLDVPANSIIPKDKDGSFTLYDLQFDHRGSYVANNIEIQSRDPQSNLTPLPRELYFDDSNYSDERFTEFTGNKQPLDFSPVDLKELTSEKVLPIV